jgi:hypothetical protein
MPDVKNNNILIIQEGASTKKGAKIKSRGL